MQDFVKELTIQQAGFHNWDNQLVVCSLTSYHNKLKTNKPSIKYIDTGKAAYKINNKQYLGKATNFAIVDADCELEIEIDNAAQTTGYCIHFDDSFIFDLYKNTVCSEHDLLERQPAVRTSFVNSIFSKEKNNLSHIIHLINHQIANGNSDKIGEQLFALGHSLIENQLSIKNAAKRIPTIKKQTSEEILKRVILARNFINDTFTQKIDLDLIAQVAMMSKYHFVRSFSKIYRITPYQYVLQKRLELAKDLLKNQNNSILDVALGVGFNDRRSFSKAFKYEFGVNPSYYATSRTS